MQSKAFAKGQKNSSNMHFLVKRYTKC